MNFLIINKKNKTLFFKVAFFLVNIKLNNVIKKC